MNSRTLAKVGLAAISAFALTGCQLVYEVSVVAQNGKLIFKTVWKRLGPDEPASVERLDVVEESQHPRTVWDVESVAVNGRKLTQLHYGQTPQGFRLKVAPERLKVGQLYKVSLSGVGGMDEAFFVVARYDLRRDITVLHE